MLQTLKLLLPALIPSWRFFDVIGPSPRIEYALPQTAQDTPEAWHEFRPRPARLTAVGLIKRLFWNPHWNETLFLASCAERLMPDSGNHSRDEILRRIKAAHGTARYLQFRLVFFSRQGEKLRKDIVYTSPIFPASEREGA